MAKEEHLNIIKQGQDAWNIWRKQNPDIIPDLSRANLCGENLGYMDLVGANLYEADLKGANLKCADLVEATLYRTNLHKANLFMADLSRANLCGVDLSQANLLKANLCEADLNGANLTYCGAMETYFRKAALIEADLSSAYLRDADLIEASLDMANFSGANLFEANLSSAYAYKADFRGAEFRKVSLNGANLNEANLSRANLSDADLSGANLSEANLNEANLSRANLSNANLHKARLKRAIIVDTNINNAIITNCYIYGISAWGVQGKPKSQFDLVITEFSLLNDNVPEITVDNLEIAQFIYLTMHSEKLRNVLTTISTKVVLILGRFKPERITILDAIRDEIRKHNYVPLLFDFPKPLNKTYIETVSTLAHLARFIIADFTDGKIVYHEVPHIVKNVIIPVKPLLLKGSESHSPVTIEDLRIDAKERILDTFEYEDQKHLISLLKTEVIDQAEEIANVLDSEKAKM